MKRMTAATMAACVAVLLPCMANGAGGQGVKQPAPPMAAPDGMIRVDDGPAASAPVGMAGDSARGVMRNRPGLELKSVLPPGDLANAIASGISPDAVPSALFWLSISGEEFKAYKQPTAWNTSGGGCISTTDGGAMIAPVHLPNGAAVYEMTLNYYRGTSSMSSWAYFFKCPVFPPSPCTLVSYVSASSTGPGRDVSAVMNVPIDNFNWSYAVQWINNSDVNNQLCTVQLAYYMPPTGTYNPITPCRQITPTAVTSTQQDLQLTGGACGVPAAATGVTANVTTFNASGTGYLAIWPQGTTYPGNSTVNYSPGLVVANSADLVLSSSGMVSVKCQTGQTVQMILDITGYFY